MDGSTERRAPRVVKLRREPKGPVSSSVDHSVAGLRHATHRLRAVPTNPRADVTAAHQARVWLGKAWDLLVQSCAELSILCRWPPTCRAIAFRPEATVPNSRDRSLRIASEGPFKVSGQRPRQDLLPSVPRRIASSCARDRSRD
jgi:hypothetical protein